MASDNETVEQVCEVLNRYPKAEVCDEDGLTVLNNKIIAKRIEAAHKREVEELRRLLKVAEDALEFAKGSITSECTLDCNHVQECTDPSHVCLCERRINEALAAIRKEGETK